MVFDQAQSPRMGQRVPVESTYVQIFDVDPSTPTADLVEAAWPGQLIFRMDIGILQIFNGVADAWQDVAGGVAGKLTYVGPDEPVENPPAVVFSEGDIWFDDDDDFKPYVWDGTSWQPSAGGIKTFHQDTPPVSSSIGDIWYNTELIYDADSDTSNPANTMYRSAVAGSSDIGDTGWVLVQDLGVVRAQNTADNNADAIGNNALALDAMNVTVSQLSYLAQSANNSADTADGRVSMSDYEPGDDDLTYLADRIDPITGETTETLIPRVNGSIWFTRTRPRNNVCTNPSFEVNDADWTYAPGVVAVRDSALYVPSGDWTLKVTASGTAPYWAAWGQNVQAACAEGDVWTASVYAELISGSGAGLILEIYWFDGTGTQIGTSTSDPYQMVLNAFDPSVLGTIAEPRLLVTGTAPPGAVSFYVRETNPNAGDVWHTGALLVEREPDLGRYFDGDSFDGSWDGDPENSTSQLVGDKIQEIWELRNGTWIRKYFTEDTLYFIDVAKLIGQLDAEVSIQDNTIATDKWQTTVLTATENLTAGNIVNVWNNNGVYAVRQASASLRQGASGFVLDTVSSGALVSVYHVGDNALMSNLSPGTQWLGNAGQVVSRPPTTIGYLVQRVGVGVTSTSLQFHPTVSVRIT
jgi:hypothetical protein